MLFNAIKILLAIWVIGGVIYLLRRHHYSLKAPHHLLMDLLGIPFDLLQRLGLQRFIPIGFLVPIILLFGIFTYFPFLLNFIFSITDGDSILIEKRDYVGLEHYKTLFRCEDYTDLKTCSAAGFNFFKGMINSFLFVLIQVPIVTLVALATALVLNGKIKVRGFWRAMFFYPVMLSPVVVVNIWTWILHRKGVLNISIRELQKKITELSRWESLNLLLTSVSLILISYLIFKIGAKIYRSIFIHSKINRANQDISLEQSRSSSISYGYLSILFFGLLMLLGLGWWCLFTDFNTWLALKPYRNINWLVKTNSSAPFFWLVFVYVWSHFGFYMLILLAGLQSIPTNYYDAAKMDGTRPLRIFFRITLPLLVPTLLVVTVLSLIKGFQIFDEAWLLTGGGPGRATFMVVQFIYEYGFYGQSKQYGMAATASVVMGLVVGVLTLIQLWISRKKQEH